MSDLKNTIEQIGSSFEQFTKTQNENLQALERRLDGFETKANRTAFGGGGEAHEAALSAETWFTPDGKAVPVLAPEHKMGAIYAAPAEHKGLTVGGMLRAMVLGARNDIERKALSEGTDSAGGYSVPVHIAAQVIDLLRARSHIFSAGARTVPLHTEKTNIVKVASDPVAAWRLENASVATSDPTFASVSFQARSLAVLVKVSRELIEDSINIEQALTMALASALGGELDRVALIGSGTAPEPRGLVNTSGIGSVSMGTNGAAITSYANLLTAAQTISDANAMEPTAAIMAPRTRFALAGLADTTGQPLRRPDVLERLKFLATTRLPVDETQGTAENASTLVMGDFAQLMVGVRSSLRIEVLRELFAENHQYGFVAHLRADVAVAQPGAFAKIVGIIPA
jgi:HK97 family phage major capsid protein